MIRLQNVWKTYRVGNVQKVVARDMTFTFPKGHSVALLGRNGAGKSSLLRMIAGTMDPDSGSITSDGTISWPVGFAGSFHPELSGAQNTRFVSRIYGVDTEALMDFVQSFADLGTHFHLPFRTYSSGMRARLAFGVSMGIPFDTYLIDEVTAVGDAAFRSKSMDILNQRLQTSGAIVVSHSLGMLKEMCHSGVFLENGRIHYFPHIESAIKHHKRRMALQIWAQKNKPAG